MSNLEVMGAANALAGTTGLGLPAALAAAQSRLTTGIDVQVYTAARIAIDLHNGAEPDFLTRLADALEIDPALAAQVDATARAAA